MLLAGGMLVACGNGAHGPEDSSSVESSGQGGTATTSGSPSDAPSAAQSPDAAPPRYSGEVEEGEVYSLADVTVVQRDGDDMEATYVVAESSSDGIPADWDPPFLIFTFEDGVTADDLGITRVSNGWVDTGDITFRVTDLDSEPPTAVLLTFDPT